MIIQLFGAVTSPSDLDEYLELTADESFHHSWIPGCSYDSIGSPWFEILTDVDITLDKHQRIHRPVVVPQREHGLTSTQFRPRHVNSGLDTSY